MLEQMQLVLEEELRVLQQRVLQQRVLVVA
jgi:hypothetical protein